jgi:acetylornithine deacetylase
MDHHADDTCPDLLRAMVGFETVNSNITGKPDAERALAEYLETRATAMGLATQRLAVAGESFNLLVTHQVDPAAPWLQFESHLDTVSIAGMTVDPLAAKIENGRMYGRGACDTKASGAAMLWALRRYAQAPGATNIALLFSIDEEVSKGGVKAFTQVQLPHLAWRPVGAIVGEPTMLRPIVAHNGIVRWPIRTRGVAAHSADPSRGSSAISMMVKVIEAIETRYIPSITATHALTGKAQCSINQITGGVASNIIPEHCEIRLDRRVVPGEDSSAVLPAVESVLDELRREHPHVEVAQDQPFLDPPLDPAGGEAFAAVVQRALANMQLPNDFEGAPYGTDASNFDAAGIPAVVLGPGDIAQAHTHDEWIELDQVDLAVEVYENLMRQVWELTP